jgi:HK97 family phage prohead protease
MELERRSLSEGLEVREIDGEVRIVGYAALYNSESHVLAGGFREVIRPGAFDDALADPATDVVALFNHDENFILGRQSAGTLQLAADERGLRYSVAVPQSRADVIDAVRLRNVAGSSFAFVVNADGEEYQRSQDGGPPLRYINRVSGLYDVSPCVHPAYPATTAAVRKRAAEFVEPIAEQAEQLPLRVSPLAQAEHVARWLRRVV